MLAPAASDDQNFHKLEEIKVRGSTGMLSNKTYVARAPAPAYYSILHTSHFKYALTSEIKSSVNSSGESGPRSGCVMCSRI